MIRSKKDLKLYLQKDREANLKNTSILKYFGYRLFNMDGYRAYRLLRTLRFYEYHINNKSNILIRYFWQFKFSRLKAKYNIQIGPNMLGPGFWLPHTIGGGIIINCTSMGNNCNTNVGVVIGNSNFSQENRPIIGNNVTFCVGSKAYGKITIGNNVVVLPNSVVISNIPDNSLVAGNPAKVIKKI